MNKNNGGKVSGPEVDGAVIGMLNEHRKGGAISDLSAAIRTVAGAVRELGKSGTVTLKLKIAVAQGTSQTLVLSDSITMNVPKEKERGSIFFTDENDNLVRSEMEQVDMPLAIDVASQRREAPAAVVDVAAVK